MEWHVNESDTYVVCCGCAGFCDGAAQAATYAVDPVKGDDANPGSAERPWKTMAPVNKLELKGGDKLLVKPGTIVGSLVPKVKGSEKKPVVVKFAPGTYGMTGGMSEIFIQSHAGQIELLPALPKEWPNGSIKGIRARGNITVDMAWKDGILPL